MRRPLVQIPTVAGGTGTGACAALRGRASED
jgi:hypothetical protein